VHGFTGKCGPHDAVNTRGHPHPSAMPRRNYPSLSDAGGLSVALSAKLEAWPQLWPDGMLEAMGQSLAAV